MLSVVPLACFLIVFLIFHKSQAFSCWRGSFLSASLLWGLLLTAITESLSLFSVITSWAVLDLWVLCVFLAMIYLNRIRDREKGSNVHLYLTGISRFEISLLVGLVLIVITVGIIAWISPPNNWDSMTYHMSRVVHWIQNRSLVNYPTAITRQLNMNPWSEFAVMHFQILSGGDRFANLIQWFSMIGTTLGISLLAKQLGANLRGQIFAAVTSATIPMGILQGSSTQNDYTVSFWLVCFVYYGLPLRNKGNFLQSAATGASLGLAILTKATAYIYAFPFMVWIVLSLIKFRHERRLQFIALIITTALVINLGHYTRNYDLCGSPIAPVSEGSSLSNEIFTISSVTSNVVRNIGLHLGTIPRLNSILENGINQLHRIIGIDPNDIRTSFGGKFRIVTSLHEDSAGNLLHLALIIVSIAILMLQQRKRQDAVLYLVCLLGAFVLFNLYLKWQPWNSRLLLPLFILSSPLVGLSLSQIRDHRIANSVMMILILGALPFVACNFSRPIVGGTLPFLVSRSTGKPIVINSIMTTDRTKQYFTNRPGLREPYLSAVQFLSNSQCLDVGLVLHGDDWEYPFWVLLGEYSSRTLRIEHINVANISQAKNNDDPFNTFTPCAVITVGANPPDEIYIRDVTYLRKWFSDPVSVFMPK